MAGAMADSARDGREAGGARGRMRGEESCAKPSPRDRVRPASFRGGRKGLRGARNLSLKKN